MTCTSGKCTSTTVNNGASACSGDYVAIMLSEQPSVSLSGMTTSLGLPFCFDSTTFPPQEGTPPFALCFGSASLAPGGSFTASANISATGVSQPSISIVGATEVDDSDTGDELAFVYALNDVSVPTCTTRASVPPVTLTGIPYSVSWTAVSQQQATYVVEESTTAGFSAISASRTTSALSEQFQHTVTANTTYYYRVHALQCSGAVGPFSATTSIVVQAAPPSTSRGTDAVVPFGTTVPVNVPLEVRLNTSGKQALDTTYTAKTDKSYLTVNPSSGTVPASGSVNLTVTATAGTLPPGANTGTVTVTTNTGTTANVPVSISLVTPVSPQGKTLPPLNTLIVPIVTHVVGFTGPFQSDVRLANTGLGQAKYQVSYTPTNTDGTQSTKSTVVPVDAGQTVALNDVVRDFFGNEAGAGSLEIRPLNSSSLLNYASSRTFVTTVPSHGPWAPRDSAVNNGGVHAG